MPPATPPRQPDAAPQDWLEGKAGQALIQQVQRQSISELTRVFGHSGLYLRPGFNAPAHLSGNMLARVSSLYRHGQAFAGDWRCQDEQFPVASGSLALVYALLVLESSPDEHALVSEISRMLKPEGTLIILSLNPLAPLRLRWSFSGLRTISGNALAGMLRENGLEVSRQRSLGPLWRATPSEEAVSGRNHPWLAPFRAATLTVARRRDAGLNPIRQSSPGIRLHTGVSTG